MRLQNNPNTEVRLTTKVYGIHFVCVTSLRNAWSISTHSANFH